MYEQIVGKIEKGLEIINTIESKNKQMSSKELMQGINFAKEILIQPYFSDEAEGKRLKYIIDMKDNFLEGSLLIQTSEDKNMLKEFTGFTIAVTELLYRASKNGYSASTFHSKVDNKGAVIVIIKAKSGQICGGYTKVGFD